MAEQPGITEEALKVKITESLQATHVEIEDMSGLSSSSFQNIPLQPRYPTASFLFYGSSWTSVASANSIICRRLWTGILSHNCVPSLREKDNTCQTSTREHGTQDGGCGYTCVDAKMLYARTMGESKGQRGGTGDGNWWRDCEWDECLRVDSKDDIDLIGVRDDWSSQDRREGMLSGSKFDTVKPRAPHGRLVEKKPRNNAPCLGFEAWDRITLIDISQAKIPRSEW